jgi:hypothetical protein
MEVGGQLHTLPTIASSNGPTRGRYLPFSPVKTDKASFLNIKFLEYCILSDDG